MRISQSLNKLVPVFSCSWFVEHFSIEAWTDAADAALAEPTGKATVLVPNPNTFIEADVDLLPTEGYGLDGTANYSISTVHDKEAWIVKMQPLPQYVLDKNRSYIKGIFWI